MTTSINNLLVKVRAYVSSRTKIGEERLMHPRRDWKVIVTIFALLVFGSAFVSFDTYLQVSEGTFGAPLATPPREAETLDVAKLTAVLSSLNEREQSLQKIRTERLPVADPSR